MANETRCQECGERNTGWRATPKFGKWVCPACAAGIKRDRPAEELARRRALLKKLEQEDNPAFERLIRDVRLSVERIEKRTKEQ